MGLRGVVHHENRNGSDVDAQFRRGGLRIRQQPRPKAVVHPGAGHEPRTARRGEGVHALDLRAHLVRAHDALLDEERDHRHLHDLVVGEGGVLQIRLGRVVMGRVHVVSAVSVRMLMIMVVPVRLSAGMSVPAHFASSVTGSSQCS